MANTLKFGDGKWATGEGTALAFNDENDNFKPLPFTFTRNSTATVVNESGLIEEVGNDVPRIDFKDNTKGALLLEPSRTNLVPYSEDFSQWNKSNVAITITTNYGLSPNGLNNSSRVQFTDASQHINISTSLGTGVTSTGSVYIKGTLGEIIRFDTGGVGGLKTLTGDWQRIEVTSTSVSSLLLINTYGGATARDIQVFGAQCEQASYATSYIPTQGSAVTRLADSCSQTVPDGVIGQTEGTVYFEIENKGHDRTSANSRLNLNQDTSTHEWIFLGFETDSKIRFYIRSSSTTSVDSRSPEQSVGIIKAAARYNTDGDWALYVNGTKTNSGSNAVVSQLLNRINIGSPVLIKDFIRDLRLYNTALTDSELATLTQV